MTLYVYHHRASGKEYVGTTTRPLRFRVNDHRSRARNGGRKNPLYDAMQTDGENAFDISVLAETESYEELLRLEREAIQLRNTLAPNGFNLVRGGRGNFGWAMPTETRQKIAAKAAGRQPWNVGRSMSIEFREKAKKAQSIRRCRERLTDMSQVPWNKGMSMTRAQTAKLHGRKPWNKGRSLTADQRSKMWWASPSSRQRTGRIISENKKMWWAAQNAASV